MAQDAVSFSEKEKTMNAKSSRRGRERYGLEDPRKAVYSPSDLVDLGFGERAQIYRLIKDGDIPSHHVGGSIKIPGEWVHRRMVETDK